MSHHIMFTIYKIQKTFYITIDVIKKYCYSKVKYLSPYFYCCSLRLLTILLQQLHATQGIHHLNKIHVFIVLYVRVEKNAIFKAELVYIIAQPHPGSVWICGRHINLPHSAPSLENVTNKRLAWNVRTILDEPFNRETGNVDSVRPFASLQLVHMLCIPEVRIPAVSGWEVVLRLGR